MVAPDPNGIAILRPDPLHRDIIGQAHRLRPFHDLPQMTRGVMVGSAGDVAVVLKSGDAITLPALSPGVIYPLRIARVLATGTTASGIKGLI